MKYRATFTNPISTGASTSGPMTAANATPEFIPNTATDTAIASSKLLLAAVNLIDKSRYIDIIVYITFYYK